jgi:hypothetical protein
LPWSSSTKPLAEYLVDLWSIGEGLLDDLSMFPRTVKRATKLRAKASFVIMKRRGIRAGRTLQSMRLRETRVIRKVPSRTRVFKKKSLHSKEKIKRRSEDPKTANSELLNAMDKLNLG